MAKKEMAKGDTIKKEIATKGSTTKGSATRDPATKDAAKKQTAAAPVKHRASMVLTTTDIGDHIASTFDLPKSHAKIYFNEAIALIGKHLKKGSRVRIAGLGVFQVKKRAARKGRNPNTGEAMKIKASKRIVFAAASDLKARL